MVPFLYGTIALFTIVSAFMILLILIQKGRGGGLASAFGGAGGNTAFGAKTGDVLTWATSIVFGIFLLLAITMNLVAKSVNTSFTAKGPVGTTSATPAAPASSDGETPAAPAGSQP